MIADRSLRIFSAARFGDSSDDNEAIEQAKQLLNGEALEVWGRTHRVARLEPK
jgi:hypothetical protein